MRFYSKQQCNLWQLLLFQQGAGCFPVVCMSGFTLVYTVRDNRPRLKLFDRLWAFRSGDTVCVFILEVSRGVQVEKTQPFLDDRKDAKGIPGGLESYHHSTLPCCNGNLFFFLAATTKSLVVGKSLDADSFMLPCPHITGVVQMIAVCESCVTKRLMKEMRMYENIQRTIIQVFIVTW